MCSDNASLVGGNASGFPALENSTTRALSTDARSNLYIMQMNFSTAFFFCSVNTPSPIDESSSWWSRKIFHADFLEWLYIKEVVSQPVKAWKGSRASVDPSGRFL